MCGIAGILRVHSPGSWPPGAAPPPPEQVIPESWLDILDESIKHRGPDGHGRFRDRVTRPDGSIVDVALVHRRLSIIDHAGGHQPMVSLGGPTVREGVGTHSARDSNLVAVVFNGCIYNHRELRKELTAAGHHFVTDHSDTEVLIHGWRAWHERLFPKLDGMFAAAIWDRARAMLIVARDVAGEKPLYFARPLLEAGEAVLFASTPIGILHILEQLAREPGLAWQASIERRIAALQESGADPTRGIELIDAGPHPVLGLRSTQVDLRHAELRHWQAMLRRPPPHPRDVRLGAWLTHGWGRGNTPFQSVSETTPAHYITSRNDGAIESSNAFWGPKLASAETGNPRPLTPDLTDELLRASVERRLEADVPLGCFLSGGIDSGLIAAYAQASLASRGDRLRTFTVRMPHPEFDESEAATATARHLGTDHQTLECSPRVADDLVHLIRQLGLPFGDSSLLPTYWLCKAAREHVRVALSGDGGDELFGGYLRYLVTPVMARHGRWLQHIPGGLIPHSAPKSRQDRLRRLILACRYGGYEDLLRIFDAADEHRLIGTQPPRSRLRLPESSNALATGPITDFHDYLPYDLLRKADTASMSVALEVRAPFLDKEVIRCAFRTPIEVRMPNGELKGLLRRVARKYLPVEVVDRPKQGFAIPIGDWFRTDYGGMKTLLMDHINSTEPWGSPSLGINLNMKFVRQMLDEHMNKKRDHSQRLYMLLVLSIWAKSL